MLRLDPGVNSRPPREISAPAAILRACKRGAEAPLSILPATRPAALPVRSLFHACQAMQITAEACRSMLDDRICAARGPRWYVLDLGCCFLGRCHFLVRQGRGHALKRQFQHTIDPAHRHDLEMVLHVVRDIGSGPSRSLPGSTPCLMPPRCAASSFSFRPPIGRTSPRSVISPVIATSARTGMPVSEDQRHGHRRYRQTDRPSASRLPASGCECRLLEHCRP
jgi:hypothetical protein